MSDRATSPWLAVTYESLPWIPAEVPMSRTARRRYRGLYDAAVPPRIADSAVPLPAAMAALVEEAAAEIARFDGEMATDIAPFAAVLLRTESAASSKIENLTASAKAIAVAELGHHGSGNARQVVANVRTMTAALGLADQIDASTIFEMHAALLGAERPDIAGKWRDEQVWIGGGDYGPHGATFVPPHQGRVGAAIADLVAFIGRDDIPVLAHAAIAHAQFETIHPFPDGNGRTGRALLHAHLRHTGLTRNVTVPVSAGLLVDTSAYFTALTAYRSGDPAPIVERLAHASFAAVGNGRKLVSELREVRHGWESRIRVRRGAAAWRIVDLLLRHPVVNRHLVASELGIAGSNVYRSLEPLVAAGVLVEFTDRRRDQMWRAPEILNALDNFAARAGRRTRAAR